MVRVPSFLIGLQSTLSVAVPTAVQSPALVAGGPEAIREASRQVDLYDSETGTIALDAGPGPGRSSLKPHPEVLDAAMQRDAARAFQRRAPSV